MESLQGLGVTAALIMMAGYFLPALIASHRRHLNKTAITVLNLLLGWTFIGWIIALVWSFTSSVSEREPKKVKEQYGKGFL